MLLHTTMYAQRVTFLPANDFSNAHAYEQQYIEKSFQSNTIKVEVSNLKDPVQSGDLNATKKDHYAIHTQSLLTISVSGNLDIVKIELVNNSKGTDSDLKNFTLVDGGNDILPTKSKEKLSWIGQTKSISLQNTKGSIWLSQIIVTLNTFGISKSCYATMWLENAYKMPEGVTGYTVSVNDGKISYPKTYKCGDIVPKETPLLINGKENTYTYDVVLNDKSKKPTNNMLSASEGKTLPAGNGNRVYKLSYDDNNQNLGFYYDNLPDGIEAGSKITVPYGKCFLRVPITNLESSEGATNAKGFGLPSIENGIDNVTENDCNLIDDSSKKKIYSLSGMFVGNDYTVLRKGVYIRNGKKIIIK